MTWGGGVGPCSQSATRGAGEEVSHRVGDGAHTEIRDARGRVPGWRHHVSVVRQWRWEDNTLLPNREGTVDTTPMVSLGLTPGIPSLDRFSSVSFCCLKPVPSLCWVLVSSVRTSG